MLDLQTTMSSFREFLWKHEVIVIGAGRRSTQDDRRVSGTPSQAYDERPAVARGSYFADAPPEPVLSVPSRAVNLDRALAASAPPDSAGDHRIPLLFH